MAFRITANQVTLARLVLMPLLCWLIYGSPAQQIWAVIIGTFVGLTDWVDGYLARKQGPTVLGGLMDPMADKVFIALSFVPFADLGLVPWELTIALFLREYLVTALRSSFEVRQRTLRSTYLAKIKTWIQMTALGLVMLMVAVRSQTVIAVVFFGAAAIPAAAGVVLLVLRRRVVWAAWVGAILHGVFAALFVWQGAETAKIVAVTVMVVLTWVSAADYLKAAIELIKSPTLFDVGRLLPAGLLPLVGGLVLWEGTAPAWAVLAVMGLEFCHGGLDNLLAHHRAAASGVVWGARLLGTLGALALTLVLPQLALPLGALAVAISTAGTAWTFWSRRQYYLEPKLRDEPREGGERVI